MFLSERKTLRRGRPKARALIALRTRALRRVAPFRLMAMLGSLLLLAFLARDEFVGVTHTLALVGLRLAVRANVRGNLANLLLVDAGNDHLGRCRRGDGDALGRLIHDFVAEAEGEFQVLALHGGTVADALDQEPLLEAVG